MDVTNTRARFLIPKEMPFAGVARAGLLGATVGCRRRWLPQHPEKRPRIGGSHGLPGAAAASLEQRLPKERLFLASEGLV